jgi:hypothetical protein
LRDDVPLTIAPARRLDDTTHREFVEVGAAAVAVAVVETDPQPPTIDPPSATPPDNDPGWSLWGDPDRST